ncbi:hypothetical protein AKJ16_DCAP08579, partial [Drosera capensis]
IDLSGCGAQNHFRTAGADEARKNPAEIVADALHCFSDGYVYRSCEESYRLTVQGDLHVPSYYIDQFCTGPCLAETNLTLNCIDEIKSNFEFYNKATIQDVGDTITAGCSYGSKRGDFNVTEHLQAKVSKGNKENASNGNKAGIHVLLLVGFNVMEILQCIGAVA